MVCLLHETRHDYAEGLAQAEPSWCERLCNPGFTMCDNIGDDTAQIGSSFSGMRHCIHSEPRDNARSPAPYLIVVRDDVSGSLQNGERSMLLRLSRYATGVM